MGAHLIDGQFQSDKYPTTPRGKVPLSCTDRSAQDLLWAYAQRHRAIDPEFSSDLEEALRLAGFVAPAPADEPPAEYAVVEVFGHRRHAGRIQEVERFGTKLLRIDVPTEGDFECGYLTHFYGGASIFSVIPADLETVRRINQPYRPVGRLSPPAEEEAPPPRRADDDDEHPF